MGDLLDELKRLGTALLAPLFGAGKAYDPWRAFAREVGGEFIQRGWYRADPFQPGRWNLGAWVEVRLQVAGRAAVLETFPGRTRYTTLRAAFPHTGGVHFTVARRGVLGGLQKLLGMQDLEVGAPDFDREFVVKGDDARFVTALFADPALRQGLLAQPGGAFGIRPVDGEPGVAELFLEYPTLIRDVTRLRGFVDLFRRTLDRLSRLDVIRTPDGAQSSAPREG